VEVRPGQTSEPFTLLAEYGIQSDSENLPPQEPKVLVVFSPGGRLNATAVNSPTLNVDVIANFNLVKGDLFCPHTQHKTLIICSLNGSSIVTRLAGKNSTSVGLVSVLVFKCFTPSSVYLYSLSGYVCKISFSLRNPQ
jgi:hypothetical protein